MLLRRHEIPIVLVNVAYLTLFTGVALTRRNFEFVLYAGVVLVIFLLVLARQQAVRFNGTVLWGLTLWGAMHMAGGNVQVNPQMTLYSVQLIPGLLRYDQLVHAIGFGTATLACHHILSGHLRPESAARASVLVLSVLMGCGLGALNEVLEFIAVKTMPETGVGGYDNTMMDLVFNLLGALAAVCVVRFRP